MCMSWLLLILVVSMHGSTMKLRNTVCNTYCFSTATMFARTRLVLILYAHCLPYYEAYFLSHIRIVMLAYYRITFGDLDIIEAL